MDSLDRCMAGLLDEEVETHGAGFRALGADAMANRFFGFLRHQPFELGLGLFVLEVGRPGPGKDAGEFCPGVGAAHINNPNRLDAWFRWLRPQIGEGARRSPRTSRTYAQP